MPLVKSKQASVVFGAGPARPVRGAGPGTHRNLPAIIRWMTTNRSSSRSQTTRLPRRRRPRTRRPSTRLIGRRHRSEQEGADDPYPLERLPDDPGTKRVKVELDVGKLGHRDIIGLRAPCRVASGVESLDDSFKALTVGRGHCCDLLFSLARLCWWPQKSTSRSIAPRTRTSRSSRRTPGCRARRPRPTSRRG